MIYYNRSTGETTNNYNTACIWHKNEMTVITFNLLLNRKYNWKTGNFE